MKNIHIGSIIKQKVDESSMSIKEFADKINCERTTVYHLYKQNSKTTHPTSTIFIAFEIDQDALQQLNLPDTFIQLLK